MAAGRSDNYSRSEESTDDNEFFHERHCAGNYWMVAGSFFVSSAVNSLELTMAVNQTM